MEYGNMNEFTKKEIDFIKRLKKEDIDISKLSRRLTLLIKYCEISAAIFAALILVIIFIIGEMPKIYHALIVLSVFFVLLSQYLNWKHTLKFLHKYKVSIESDPNFL
jgi:hypothetical protein